MIPIEILRYSGNSIHNVYHFLWSFADKEGILTSTARRSIPSGAFRVTNAHIHSHAGDFGGNSLPNGNIYVYKLGTRSCFMFDVIILQQPSGVCMQAYSRAVAAEDSNAQKQEPEGTKRHIDNETDRGVGRWAACQNRV